MSRIYDRRYTFTGPLWLARLASGEGGRALRGHDFRVVRLQEDKIDRRFTLVVEGDSHRFPDLAHKLGQCGWTLQQYREST